MPEYEVIGCDKAGNVVFHVAVEAPTKHVAKLYATARLQRAPEGAETANEGGWHRWKVHGQKQEM